MKKYDDLFKWAANVLIANGYVLVQSPEVVTETPWSTVIRFSTSNHDLYLKQTPPSLFLESKILQFLSTKLHASVPEVVASNEKLNCFLMKDAGISLRKYLKDEFQPELMDQAVKQFSAIQRSTEKFSETLFELGVPDWRLNKLPDVFNELLNQKEFLKKEGLTDQELKLVKGSSQHFSEDCALLAEHQIPATIVQPDFHTNNILFDAKKQKMTFIDLGEIVISHPFISLQNFLDQAITHHGINEQDEIYNKLLDICFESWPEIETKNQLLVIFMLIKKIWPIYSALGHYRLMMSVDLNYFKSYYSDRPNRIAGYLREYLVISGKQ